MLVYKILTAEEHARFRAAGRFEGSRDDLADGFIHLSAADQVARTAARHFADRGALTLLACDAAALGDALRWEPSRSGTRYPHLYRALKAGDVAWQMPYAPDPAGQFPSPDAAPRA